MKLLQILIIAITLLSITNCKCICPGSECSIYDGTFPNCLCWCNDHVDEFSNKNGLKCNYLPDNQDSSGGCALCGTGSNEVFEKANEIYSIGAKADSDIRFSFFTSVCPGQW
ncbi:hypothetical protein M0812_18745 [Anaeramoeba flamelloides]|uniref:Uncharacterized protein n=1 Tax=Anaeramoeba flamelloides TaxID=1746091 RepID=A0AAV7Z950_9EUKA|nr:hypothetical protein M0812_18745 [Anaeramoeba flamelloides]